MYVIMELSPISGLKFACTPLVGNPEEHMKFKPPPCFYFSNR